MGLIKRVLLGEKADPDTYLSALRNKGMNIGEGVKLFASPRDCVIDEQNPYLVTIGDNVQLTRGVIILTHDYSWSVVKGLYGEVLGHQAPVTIGSNVFIGMNAVILSGTTIGDNVIVGAGSIVSGLIPSNVVVAGNPARVICGIEDYRKKRRDRQLSEAVNLYLRYTDRYGCEPKKEIFREYFWLFEISDESLLPEFCDVNVLVAPDVTAKAFVDWTPNFNGFSEFIEYCRLKRAGLPDTNGGR